jgi:hypothetical protein
MMQSSMMGGGAPPTGPGGGGLGPGGPNAAGAQSPFAFPFAHAGAETATQQQSTTGNVLDTLFNLLRITVFALFGVALVYGALGGHAAPQLSVTEDESSVVEKFEHMTTLHRWARLAYEKPAHWEARYFGVESFGLPIHGIVSESLEGSHVFLLLMRSSSYSHSLSFGFSSHWRLHYRALESCYRG